MLTHFKFPACSTADCKGRSVTVRDAQGHEKLTLAMACDTTCATLDVKPRYTVELYDTGKLVSKVVISKSLSQNQTVSLPCPAPETTAAPATPPIGEKPEPKVAPDVPLQTPAQKYAAGLRPVLVAGKVVWQ